MAKKMPVVCPVRCYSLVDRGKLQCQTLTAVVQFRLGILGTLYLSQHNIRPNECHERQREHLQYPMTRKDSLRALIVLKVHRMCNQTVLQMVCTHCFGAPLPHHHWPQDDQPSPPPQPPSRQTVACCTAESPQFTGL